MSDAESLTLPLLQTVERFRTDFENAFTNLRAISNSAVVSCKLIGPALKHLSELDEQTRLQLTAQVSFGHIAL